MRKLMGIFLFLTSACWANDNKELLISSKKISQKVEEVARILNEEYRNEELTILIVLKGAICISADLIEHLTIPFQIEFIKASSYGQNGTERGALTIQGIENLDLTSKNILIVDDIFDTGHTMSGIIARLQEKNPKSVKSLVLLLKKVPRQITYLPDYVLFEIENRFVIGYGLDYKEYYRGLPGIYAFINDTPPKDL
jgi:hypoxanthine phosphoribosyltransferase